MTPGGPSAAEARRGTLLVRAATYAVDEALSSLWRARQSGVFSMATVASPLLVLGAFLLVTSNLERLVAGWSSSAELSVYLADEATDADREGVERILADSALVVDQEHVSREAARTRFQRDFGDLAPIVDGFEDNPFPASFEVQIAASLGGGAALDALAAQLAAAPGVEDVRYDRQWLDRLAVVVTFTRTLGLLFAAILIAGAVLTVANVIRLTFAARRDEVEIMRLVGAPAAFIRGPFIVEGLVQGGVGGLAALGLLWGGYFVARSQFGALAADTLGPETMNFLPLPVAALLVTGGMLVGGVGGLLATRNPRSVHEGTRHV